MHKYDVDSQSNPKYCEDEERDLLKEKEGDKPNSDEELKEF